MGNNPDTYLLYECGEKLSFTMRMKYRLDEAIDVRLLEEAAREAFTRYPYFSVKVGLDENQNYTLIPNDKPIAVLPEQDRRIVLGSDEVNGHLFFISYRNDTIYFNASHAPCGGFGLQFWVKTTLYSYMCKKYGQIDPPKDLKFPGSPVTEGELFYPDPNSLPKDEPISRYNGGDSNLAIGRFLKYLLNPFAKENYYYEIEIPADKFMEYAQSVDGSPYTILTAMMYKVTASLFKEKKGTHISGRIAADYRKDIGANESYRDFVRFIHVKYEWSMRNELISKLNMRARGAMVFQNQPELAYERFIRLEEAHRGIDAQPDLKQKRKYAAKHSTFRSDPRDNYTISYLGQVDLGGMQQHIKSVYNITDGDLMLEVNAIDDKFFISFQLIDKNKKPLTLFLDILKTENIPFTVSERKPRHLPSIKLPE